MSGVRHIDKEWRFHDVDLSQLTSVGPFRLRWVLKSNAGLELGGWAVDDVCVVTADSSVCGDHEISEAEECDDGNQDDGDGCSRLCQLEGGGCCSASPNPLGPLALAMLVGVRLRRRQARSR
jgi:cysteine-rich repeat protein